MVSISAQFEHDYVSFAGCARRFGAPGDSGRFVVLCAILLGPWSIDSIVADMRISEKMGEYCESAM